MKITAIIMILIGIMQVSAATYAQKITIKETNAPLKVVIEEIRKQSGYDFIFDANLINRLKPITININQATIETALDICLKDEPLSYTIEDKFVVLKAKSISSPSTPLIANVNDVMITGRVLDEKGLPISGVTVKVQNTQVATSTKEDGSYRIVVPGEKSILIFSFVGFEPQVVVVTNKTEINISLKPQNSNLNEVVVVGYGTQNRKDVTTSVSSLGPKDINDFPATGVDKAMTGKMAGIQVLQPNGAPGAGISIKVRGTGTITAGSDPLYVVDGVPLSDNDVNGPGFKVNPLDAINVNDIESIDVLKDASAAAIYGSRGSNGVVIITTKRGNSKKPAISLNSYYGTQSVTKKIPMLDAYQYAQLIYDAHNNTYLNALTAAGKTGGITDNNATRLATLGQSPTNTSLPYLLPPEIFSYLNGQRGLTNTNWQDALFQRAPMQSHTISATGGSDNIQYYVSGNYLDQVGTVVNTGYKKYGGRINVDAHYNHLKLGASFNYNYGVIRYANTEGAFGNTNGIIGSGLVEGALVASPFFPVKNSDGTYNFNQYKWQYSESTGINPVALAMLRTDVTYEKKLLNNVFAEYEIIPDLKFKVSFGADISDFNRSEFNPSTLPNPLTLATPSTPTAEYLANSITNWITESTLTYKKRWGNHSLQALAGYTLQKEMSNASDVAATGFPNDLVKTINGATTVTNFTNTTGINEWSLLSGLARLQYSYKGKYLLSAAIRADGSSRFGPNTKYGYFPSASAGWIVSDEDFMKKVDFVSQLKLRLSYGQTGNFQIGNYAYLSTLGPSNYILGSGSGGLQPGLFQNTLGNPNLGWEKTAAVNLGTDIGLFNNHLNATIDVYSNNTSNLLLNIPVAMSTGYSTQLVNIGKVNNKGIEVTLSNTSKIGKLKWSNNVNYSANRNKVLDLGGQQSIITQANGVLFFITEVGKPIGNYYTLVQTGVFKDQADINNTPAKVPNSHPGDFKFKDVNGDGIIDGNDKTITGNYQPKFTYGYSTQLQYGIFDLSASAQGIYGNTIANIAQRHYNSTESYANNTTDALKRYYSPSNPGDGKVAIANRSQTGLNSQISTYHLSSGSYLRIRDLTFGATLPAKTSKSIGLSSARIYVTAMNPFTFTKYNGYNPEVSVNANPLTPGVDYGSYPISKTFLIGLNVKL